jgi:hypothetical protein
LRSSSLAVLGLCGTLAGACTSVEPPAADGADLEIAGEPAAWFETDRLRFAYPGSLDIVEREPGDTQSVRIETPSDRGDHAEVFVYATWPLLQGDSLDETVALFEPDRASSAIQDFDEAATQVPGASEAVEQRFVATDAVPGDVVPITCRAVYAMADIGRTMHLIACAEQAATYDAAAVVDGVIDSLQLLGGGSSASAAAEGRPLLGGSLQVGVPDSWQRANV